VEAIHQHGLILKTFAEQALCNTEVNGGMPEGGWTDRTRSCVFLGDADELTAEDRHFLRATESLEPLMMALVAHSPHILFAHVANATGVTRGYPWKDMSVLPPYFRATDYSFFTLPILSTTRTDE